MVPDIFVSYAHVDNQPFSGGEKGWITHFINNLRIEVSRRIGRAEHYQLWMDFRLKGSDELTPEIEQQLAKTDMLVILMSQGWLASEWCQRELDIFLQTHPDTVGRIFVVEVDSVETASKPERLHDLLSYRFWQQNDRDEIHQLGYPVPQKTDAEYFNRLVNLSHHLAQSVRAAKQAAPVVEVEDKPTVYVAPVNDSLFSQRESLISELRQFGIDVLPQNNTLEGNMDRDLARCSHFVQLLDAKWTMGIPFNQHFSADAAKKPILQWRDPNLDYMREGIFDEQKKLLEGKTVIASPLPDFIRRVRDAVLPKPPEPEPVERINGEKMIFVHASQDDFERAYQLAQVLRARGYGIALPRYQGDATRIRKSIERGYESCDILLMLQQKASADVVEDYLSDARAQTLKREVKPQILICQDDGAEELFFIPAGITMLGCNANFDDHCLEQFLAEVEK
ncbi:toll/interleukin-1 receptor domain-containing protein [Thiothrix nivea]|uniref:TIR domain-containing protein n=1 Tax=Thiothrix nivea (strain ATCC 35100 / DSM 5205 / JP2) TaxID=870187 RepID=A0A656HA16_THINJ|nr:toll/interleukin-1 receptor domain-containing protein [Thiothrix nivea]EIJ32983.1 hypothetical protein Thini_0325 [Thiothrix nivea DSM 5205]